MSKTLSSLLVFAMALAFRPSDSVKAFLMMIIGISLSVYALYLLISIITDLRTERYVKKHGLIDQWKALQERQEKIVEDFEKRMQLVFSYAHCSSNGASEYLNQAIATYDENLKLQFQEFVSGLEVFNGHEFLIHKLMGGIPNLLKSS